MRADLRALVSETFGKAKWFSDPQDRMISLLEYS